MNTSGAHMFSLDEAAVAYAAAAEHMFAGDAALLNDTPAVVPLFVSMLFQAIEISIKHVGVESGLFTMQEARSRKNRSGHGVKELAALAVEKLGGDPFDPIIMAMTCTNKSPRSERFIREMICGPALEKTRESYTTRCLGYGEVYTGDFAIIDPIAEWIDSVKQTAVNLSKTVDILSKWKASASASKHFAVWFREC